MNNYPDDVSAGDPRAPWNQPDPVDLEDCPTPFDGDCANPECDHCHCADAPACGCDGAKGKCPGLSKCDVAGYCECDIEPDFPCRCPGDICYC